MEEEVEEEKEVEKEEEEVEEKEEEAVALESNLFAVFCYLVVV